MAATWKKLAFEDDVITKALLTEQGDIIYASAASTPAALAHGTAGDFLKSGGNGANPSWQSPDDTAGGTDSSLVPITSNVHYDHCQAADPHAGYILESLLDAAGDIIYASADNTPAILSVGDNDDVLTLAAGVPSWAPPGAPAAHTLDDHDPAAGAVDFSGEQAHDVVLDTYANFAALPNNDQVGQIAWATDPGAAYLLTAYSV